MRYLKWCFNLVAVCMAFCFRKGGNLQLTSFNHETELLASWHCASTLALWSFQQWGREVNKLASKTADSQPRFTSRIPTSLIYCGGLSVDISKRLPLHVSVSPARSDRCNQQVNVLSFAFSPFIWRLFKCSSCVGIEECEEENVNYPNTRLLSSL